MLDMSSNVSFYDREHPLSVILTSCCSGEQQVEGGATTYVVIFLGAQFDW
jgi:hypothetical protein